MLLVGTGGDAGICALLPLTQRHRHKPAASAADGADGGQPEAPTTPRFQQMGEEPSSSCFLSAGWDGRVLKFDLALLAEAAAEES